MWWYSLGIHLYGLAIRIASLFNKKAKCWINGRQNWEVELRQWKTTNSTKKIVWIHCASLGEFEMAIPLLEQLSSSKTKKVVSFFSPSGFQYANKHPALDFAIYLPLDTPKNAKLFLQILQPSVFILVKYDFWFNHIKTTLNQQIPIYLINGKFPNNHFIFSPLMEWARALLSSFTTLYVQEISDKKNLLKNNIPNSIVTSDMRLQRVTDRKNRLTPLTDIKKFKVDKPLLVLGSSWPKEESTLQHILPLQNWKIIIAPHDISNSHIEEIINRLPSTIHSERWSNKTKNWQNADVLIIDKIGLLASIYAYANCAFIGGGFSGKLHNILEAAVYQIPICTGPLFEKFPEAIHLEKLNVLSKINVSHDLEKFLIQALDKQYLADVSSELKNHFNSNKLDLHKMANNILACINL